MNDKMTRMEKEELYDELCALLTDYEHSEECDGFDKVTNEDLYSMLVKIQNNWESLTGIPK